MRSVSELRQLLDELEFKTASEQGEPGLSNAEIRQITHLDRFQVIRLTLPFTHKYFIAVKTASYKVDNQNA